MTNVEALKALYVALGGTAADVADANKIVDVLNAIAAKYEGDDDATLNAQGIANITEIIGNITADLTILDVTPTTEAQNIKPTAPIDGYNEVNVSAVTAAIDSNITAGNIKKDVQILGVTGSYEGSGGETFEVGFVYDVENDQISNTTKTYAETQNAITEGKNVVFKIETTEPFPEGITMTLGNGYTNSADTITVGGIFDMNGTKGIIILVWCDPSKYSNGIYANLSQGLLPITNE